MIAINIPLKKRYQIINLVLGLLYLVNGGYQILGNTEVHWIQYGWFVLAFTTLGIYGYQRKYPYLEIKEGILTLNGPWGKRMPVDEIQKIRKVAGDYILTSESREITINTQLIDKEFHPLLENSLAPGYKTS